MVSLSSRIEKWTLHEPMSGCLLWFGYLNQTNGRPVIRVARKNKIAYRVAWEMKNGPILNGLQVCHKCDNKLCLNTDHLFLGTQQDNANDAVKKGRSLKGIRNPSVKITEESIDVIRYLKAIGVRGEDIGKLFGVSGTNINSIYRGKLWAHV